MQDKKARFRCGQLCTTPAALDKVGRAGLIRLLERHLSGDWGDTCESDARANEEALRSGNRIISWYQVSKELRIMIITEADRRCRAIRPAAKKLFYMLSVKLSDEKCDKWYRRFYYNLRLQMQEYYQHKAVIMDSYWNHHMEKSYGEADEV